MSDDLVKRLRQEAGTLATMYEAATEIERLRAARNAVLEEAAKVCDVKEIEEDAAIKEAVQRDVTGGTSRFSAMAAKYTARNLARAIRALKENT